MFASEAAIIGGALGERALLVEHMGSTAVPGLIAKPCIDILLAVAGSSDEDAYLPQLDAARFVLRIRQPDWNEHRVFKSERINVNLHVWSIDSPEVDRHLYFRDWLRTHPEDLDLYAATKQRIAAGHHNAMPEYAEAKNDVMREIQAGIDRNTDTSS